MLKQSIYFFYEDTTFKLRGVRHFREWIRSVFDQEAVALDHLNYIFCSDNYLHKMNIQYLKHDTFTDIITFDTSELNQPVTGDIFISIDRVRENAVLNSTTFNDELKRVIIHGALHLIGFSDKTSKQKSQMRQKENEHIATFPVKH